MISVTIPIRIESRNKSEHWSNGYARKKSQAANVALVLKSQIKHCRLPVTVTLTRVAPRDLDSDNLQGGDMKAIRDQVAALLIPGLRPGQADSDPRITWHYAQEKAGPRVYALRIEIKPRNVNGYQT